LDKNLFQGSTVPGISLGAGKEDILEENLNDPQAEELQESLGVSICLNVVSIETLDLDTSKS
jgi:hypothetical protein